MVITIDGPAGAGKSTVARALAERLAFEYLDTGAIYRAVTVAAERAEIGADDAERLASLIQPLRIRATGGRTLLGDEDVSRVIREPWVTARVRDYAAQKVVRDFVTECSRAQGSGRDLVSEGRDQGTVVFPQAECKFFVTASAEVRARRRWRELSRLGHALSFEEVLNEQRERDRKDSERALAPLRPADDAIEIDTGGLAISEVLDRLEQMVCRRQAIGL